MLSRKPIIVASTGEIFVEIKCFQMFRKHQKVDTNSTAFSVISPPNFLPPFGVFGTFRSI